MTSPPKSSNSSNFPPIGNPKIVYPLQAPFQNRSLRFTNGGRRKHRDNPTRIPNRTGQEDHEARQGHQQGELGSVIPRLVLCRALPSFPGREISRGRNREEAEDREARTHASRRQEAPADE